SYLAESGQLAQTPAGARLLMFDGTIEQTGTSGAQLSVLKFKSYAFDLDQFAGQQRSTDRATSERFLGELLWPSPALKPSVRAACARCAGASYDTRSGRGGGPAHRRLRRAGPGHPLARIVYPFLCDSAGG